MHQCLFWTHIKMFPCGYKHQSLIRYFFMLMKIFWYHHFLPFITECTTASISWYRYNRISAYSADHGSIQTTPWRTQVRLNSLYSCNDKRLVSKLITLYQNWGDWSQEQETTGTVQDKTDSHRINGQPAIVIWYRLTDAPFSLLPIFLFSASRHVAMSHIWQNIFLVILWY